MKTTDSTGLARRAWLACLVALLAIACTPRSKTDASAIEGGTSGARRLRIAVVPKGTTHEFWKSVHAGVLKASKDADVDVVWKGPIKEDDLKAQIDVVESFVAQGVSGIVLAPLNDSALRGPVKAAVNAKIPVVVFDSDLKGDEYVSFVATDNEAAGAMAARAMTEATGGKGRLVVLRYQEGSASTQRREKGFLDAISREPGLVVASANQYGGATTESAFQKSESLLLAHGAQKGDLAGVFAPNESTTFGMLQALRRAGVNKKVKVVGFDASDKLVAALKEGDIDALVVQDPFKMGYLAVKTMADHLRGKSVEKRIDTGARVIDRSNVDAPEVRELLQPSADRWIGD